MMPEMLSHVMSVWVTQYVAGFCLITIAAWACGMYVFAKKWEQPVRDAGVYFLTIGTLALILAIRPTTGDMMLWSPVVWFCFIMLMVTELLWVSFLFDTIYRGCVELKRLVKAPVTDSPHRQNPPRSRGLRL